VRRRQFHSVDEAIGELCSEDHGVDPVVLEQVLTLGIEIAREGREGHRVGTLFAVGDTGKVLASSRCMILDPLLGHPDEHKRIDDPDLRETVKELALLDGGFVVSEDGIVISAARYFDAWAEGVELPLGLGSRHIAAASVTKRTRALAVVVSESAVVRLFEAGQLVAQILPELWMLRRYGRDLRAGEEAAPRVVRLEESHPPG
jgi:DNA integrity scanning protein DisA with diadenylate cyclase activity